MLSEGYIVSKYLYNLYSDVSDTIQKLSYKSNYVDYTEQSHHDFYQSDKLGDKTLYLP